MGDPSLGERDRLHGLLADVLEGGTGEADRLDARSALLIALTAIVIDPDRWPERRRALDLAVRLNSGSAHEDSIEEVGSILMELRATLASLELRAVRKARRKGYSWGQVAEAFGLGSRQAARQRYYIVETE